jgi:hypothetical protein
LRLAPAAAVVLSGLAFALPVVAVAQAKPSGGKSATGYDLSYPQCGGSFPTNVLFGIVGVNRGIVYSANPCLGSGAGGSELSWAQKYEGTPILYANTGDPDPTASSHWPTGQTSPEVCDPMRLSSSTCSYDYGWNAAADSYKDAVDAYVSLGRLPAGATQTPQPNDWWLDVETANSWQQSSANNVSELQGEVAYLRSQGVSAIGIYANAADWSTITGGSTAFSGLPSWRPGAGSQRAASGYCGGAGVTGGLVEYSQYASSGFDADVRCF